MVHVLVCYIERIYHAYLKLVWPQLWALSIALRLTALAGRIGSTARDKPLEPIRQCVAEDGLPKLQ
jgi:hypothetical protein